MMTYLVFMLLLYRFIKQNLLLHSIHKIYLELLIYWIHIYIFFYVPDFDKTILRFVFNILAAVTNKPYFQ